LAERPTLGETFDTWSTRLGAGMWPTGWFFANLGGAYARTIDYANAQSGDLLTVSPYVSCKLGRSLSANLGHTYETMAVEDGRLYTANVSYLRTVYQFSPEVFVRAILQLEGYDFSPNLYADPASYQDYEGLSSQVLFSYKLNPQTVLFLGYNDSHYGDQTVDLTQTDRTLFAKIGYAWTM
jgi:hypothetical protein